MLLLYIAAALLGAALLFFGLLCLCVRPRRDKDRVGALMAWDYAHRGLFTPDTDAPENSRAAFSRAVQAGYAIELDVQLSSDGQLFVMHDAKLDRTACGEGYLIDKTAAELDTTLLRGCKENVPRFTEVLALVGGRVPLLIELKTVRGNHNALADAVMAVLADYDGPYCLESFDPRAVYALRRYPTALRGQLSARLSGEEGLLPWALDLLQRNLVFNCLTHPDFVAYRHSDTSLGLRLCRRLWHVPLWYWTVTDPDTFTAVRARGGAPIFEGFDPKN